MIQKLKTGWRANSAPIEAMSASMALAFLTIFTSGRGYSGLVEAEGPLANRVFWVGLCALASIPYFVGWALDIQRIRNYALFAGATFWSLVAWNYTMVLDTRGITWGIYAAFVAWAYLTRRRSRAR